MKKHLQHYFIAQSFLTRLPVPKSATYTDKQIGRSALYYPAVGLLIGCILGLLAWVLSFASPMLSAVIITTVWVITTGALHLDGLADSADAWLGGHSNKERIFTIMHDPRLGTAGVVSLVLVLLLKVSALTVLLESSQWLLVILIPSIARLAATTLIFILPSAKEEGLAYTVKQNMPINDTFALLFTASILLLVLAPALFIFAAIIFFLLKQMMLKQIGGMTGDTVGATIEIIEAMALVFMASLV